MLRFVLALGVLAGCVTPSAPDLSAHTDVSASPSFALDTLAPVEQPDLPAPLRPSYAPAMDHGAMGHGSTDSGSMDHGSMEPLAAPASTPLAAALDAYLVVHDALARDTMEGVAEAARTFATAFDAAIQAAPADDPHLWHSRMEATSAVQAHAQHLAHATDLADARTAFGELSAPFADLVDAAGAPDGYDLVRHTCGMQTDAPEGGVWLQRAGDVRNPYFGAAMQMCSRTDAPIPSGATDPATHDHGS